MMSWRILITLCVYINFGAFLVHMMVGSSNVAIYHAVFGLLGAAMLGSMDDDDLDPPSRGLTSADLPC